MNIFLRFFLNFEAGYNPNINVINYKIMNWINSKKLFINNFCFYYLIIFKLNINIFRKVTIKFSLNIFIYSSLFIYTFFYNDFSSKCSN